MFFSRGNVILVGVVRIFSVNKEQSYTKKNQDATILSVTYAEKFHLKFMHLLPW